MIKPELFTAVSDIINSEFNLSIVEANEMCICHEMGLQGYKRFHRFNCMDRHRHAIMLSNFLVEFHHTMPSIAVSHKSANVSTTLIESLQKMYDISIAHIKKLKTTAKLAIDSGEDLLMGMIEKMIKDESEEAERYWREILELQNANSDPAFTMLHSAKLHCKYKEKEKKYFNYEV